MTMILLLITEKRFEPYRFSVNENILDLLSTTEEENQSYIFKF